MEPNNESGAQSISPAPQDQDIALADVLYVESKRLRKATEETVAKITKSISAHGQMQSIGVRRTDDGRYQLGWGYVRLLATQKVGHATIRARVFPPETTDAEMDLYEIIENLHRQELTPDERAAHLSKYSALMKESGKVQPARAKQARTQSKRKSKASTNSLRPSSAAPTETDDGEDTRPTITEMVATQMNITPRTAQKHAKRAIELAKKQGVEIDDNATLETMDAETLDRIADAALKQTQVEKDAEEKRQLTMNDVLEAAAKHENSKPKKIVDPVTVMITKMWQTYNGKTVTIDLFRQIVADATEIPGRAGIVKAALAKFDPPVS